MGNKNEKKQELDAVLAKFKETYISEGSGILDAWLNFELGEDDPILEILLDIDDYERVLHEVMPTLPPMVYEGVAMMYTWFPPEKEEEADQSQE